MQINNTNKINLNNKPVFKGKEDNSSKEEGSQISSYNDKSANAAISNMGKTLVNTRKKC